MFSKAKWIWNSAASNVNAYADFTDTFECSGDAVIRIACDGDYLLRINEKIVGFGQYKGYDDLQFYDEYVISDYVCDETNNISVTIHHPGVNTSTYRKGTPGVIFEITSETGVVCFSSPKTMTRINPHYVSGDTVPMVTGQLGFSFELDLTKDQTEACESILSDRSYVFKKRPVKKLDVLSREPSVMIAAGGFSDRAKDEIPAIKMYTADLKLDASVDSASFPSAEGKVLTSEFEGCLAIVDLGAINTGILSLDIEVEKDTEILVGWGEHIVDGRVRTSIGSRSFAAKLTIPAGRHSIENPFLRLGLRYLQIHVYASSCRIFYAGIKPTLYPLPAIAPAPISDEMHSKIYDVCVRTLHMCMHEHYEDCPWREQALYSMDSRNQMLCGYHVFGETTFPRASIELIAHSLRDDGFLELCSPARIGVNIPVFSAMFVVQLEEYLAHSGDVAFIKEMFPTAKRIIDNFLERIEPNGLFRAIPGKTYWNFYEWTFGLEGGYLQQEDPEKRTYDAPLCAFVSMALISMAKICGALKEDASLYRQKYDDLTKATQDFWIEEQQCYASFIFEGKALHYSELTNSLFLYAGLVPEDKRGIVREKLKAGGLTKISLSHSIFKYEALLADPANKDYVLSDIAEIWGEMLAKGATTFWETVDGDKSFENAGSLCHGWSAIPAYIYFLIMGKEN